MISALKKGASFVVVLGIVALLAIIDVQGCMPEYSVGERSGTIFQFSTKGYFCKSYVAEMLVETKPQENQDSSFSFRVLEPTIVQKIKSAQRSGKRVTIAYKQWFFPPFCFNSAYVAQQVIEGDI